jgi:hypothetical protein
MRHELHRHEAAPASTHAHSTTTSSPQAQPTDPNENQRNAFTTKYERRIASCDSAVQRAGDPYKATRATVSFTMDSTQTPDPGETDTGQPVSRWAIAAFLLGLVSLAPLSVIAGIIALVKARDGRLSGRGLAIAGMVISVVWTAVWAYSAWPKDGLITGTVQSAPTMRVGQCFEDSVNSPASCDKPHSNEVFAILALSRFPDSDAEQKQIEDRCKAELPNYSSSASRDPKIQVGAWPPGTQ